MRAPLTLITPNVCLQGRLRAASCTSLHLMRLLLSASRDETLQLSMQTCQSECPTMHGACTRREWRPVAARPRHAGRGRPSQCASHRIASHRCAPAHELGLGVLPPDHMMAQPRTGQPEFGPQMPSQPTEIPQHKPQRRRPAAGLSVKPTQCGSLCRAFILARLSCWPLPVPFAVHRRHGHFGRG